MCQKVLLSLSVNHQRNKIQFRVLLLLFLFCRVVHCKKHQCDKNKPLLNFLSKRTDQDSATICRAHSHNDYHQADPLSSALKYGLKSIEVDVFPRQGGLWVGHTVFELNPRRTIDSLYIQPLRDIFKKNKNSGKITRNAPNQESLKHQGGHTTPTALSEYPRGGGAGRSLKRRHRLPRVDNLNLLVDFKGDADESASLLKVALSPLRPFLSRVDRNGVFHQGRLTVLISGNRPSLSSLQSPNGDRYLFLDGRIKDIHSNADTHLVPLVSLPWRHIRLARAMGRGEAYMKQLSEKAHAQGKLVRIWGAPNHEGSWHRMVRGNIDLLSIDDHAKFAQFVSSRQFSR